MKNPCAVPSAGRCYLVGAGPGDPELLTLKALRLIQAATLLLVDDLVSPAIVGLAGAQARVVQVGKRGGRDSTAQEFIEKLMLLAVQQGELVVRLKGGDPFVFGRGGEELEHLRAAGVEVEVVNGITAGLAAATSMGVPLTHRDHAHGVVFVTGHSRPGAEELDWTQLAQTAQRLKLTLVIYMGVAAAARIQAQLLAGGMSAATPVALVQDATLPAQQQLLTQLGRLSEALESSGLGSPCVFVVGEVVRLADPAGAVWSGLLDELQSRGAA